MAEQVFQSFSGTDIHAVFNDKIFGELQMVSYKIDREKAPVYTMGSADLRTIARGKRLITGASVFVVFDKDSLLTVMNDQSVNQDSTGYQRPFLNKSETANFNDGAVTAPAGGSVGIDTNAAGDNVSSQTAESLSSTFTQQSDARLVDQLLPFDITLVGASEYGNFNKMVIQGVELMSEAGGISIDDLVIEKQMSFIARSIQQWTGTGTSSATGA